MSAFLSVTDSDGKQLDTLSLVDGSIQYGTGRAKDMVDNIQYSSQLSDEELFATLTDWSNGYITIKEKEER